MPQITVTKILDGARNAAFHIAIAGTGGGEETDAVLIDPAYSFDPALPAMPTLTLTEMLYDLVGFNAKLEFDYLVSDTPLWSMSGGSFAHVCLDFGGLKDRSNPLDGQGKIKITTNGLGAGDHGVIVIKLRKD